MLDYQITSVVDFQMVRKHCPSRESILQWMVYTRLVSFVDKNRDPRSR
ncbi:MAG: hypothetical protein ACW98K_18095 [Candidatus Kariarchaeaceae archaeon]